MQGVQFKFSSCSKSAGNRKVSSIVEKKKK